MAIEKISSRHLGKEETCRLCKSGSMISFNWQYSLDDSNSNLPRSKDLYVNERKLKTGTLFQCKICSSYWYLDSAEQFMNHVKDEKLQVINLWSDSDQRL